MGKISKEDAARILGLSERTLERNAAKYQQEYGIRIEYEQGRTKRVPVFDEAQIRDLSHRLKTPLTTGQLLPAEVPRTEMATQSDNGGAGLSLLSALASLASSSDTRPVWMTRAQALEASGLPPTWFDLLVRRALDGHKLLPSYGHGQAWRVRRDDVLALARHDELPELIARLRAKE
jgi:hypothetical protein